MKAITVRYFAATGQHGAYLKAFDMDKKASVKQSRDFAKSVEDQARDVAFQFMSTWQGGPFKITGSGQISRDDYVFTVARHIDVPVTVSDSIRLQKEGSNV